MLSNSRRRCVATTIAVATAAVLLVVGAPMAQAAPVPYAVDFEAPAIPVGGTNQAYLDCPTDVGAAVTVTVLDPAAISTDHVTMAADASATVPGRVFVEVGAGGLFAANQAGTWSATVKCAGYDPYTTTFQALAPTLGLTVALNRDYDCTTPDTGFLVGDRSGFCLTLTNNSGQDIRRYGLVRPDGVGFGYPKAGEFPTGTTKVLPMSGSGAAVPFAGETYGGLYVWAELGTDGSGVFAVTAMNSITAAALPAPLALTTTTGLTAATACADTGGLADRTVATGTAVYVCYRVTNTAGVTFRQHDLTDSGLGVLVTDLNLDLAPGASTSFVTPAPVTVTAAQTLTGTWNAIEQDTYSALDDDYVATATASATVEISAPVVTPTPTTTPVVTPDPAADPAPVTDPVVVAVSPAIAVHVTPAFTG